MVNSTSLAAMGYLVVKLLQSKMLATCPVAAELLEDQNVLYCASLALAQLSLIFYATMGSGIFHHGANPHDVWKSQLSSIPVETSVLVPMPQRGPFAHSNANQDTNRRVTCVVWMAIGIAQSALQNHATICLVWTMLVASLDVQTQQAVLFAKWFATVGMSKVQISFPFLGNGLQIAQSANHCNACKLQSSQILLQWQPVRAWCMEVVAQYDVCLATNVVVKVLCASLVIGICRVWHASQRVATILLELWPMQIQIC
jgi:hypothetical protein